jgi:hypothetical protein
MLRNKDERVGGIQPDADEINLDYWTHGVHLKGGSELSTKEQ